MMPTLSDFVERGLCEYADLSVYTFCDLFFYTCCMAVVFFFSYLSQTKKCMPTVRVALVQCLVALLEVSSQRGYLTWSFKYHKMLDFYLLYVTNDVTCQHVDAKSKSKVH